jgi:hypothetical protein
MQKNAPDFILFDIIQSWIPETATKFGVPCVLFGVFYACALAFTGPPAELKSLNQRTKPALQLFVYITNN